MTPLRAELEQRGWVVVRQAPEADPWAWVEALVGERPTMLERQVIRPAPNARSFAGSTRFTPLHTDSQDFLGCAPTLQVMVCRRPAAQGGASLLLDGQELLRHLEQFNPTLWSQLFDVNREIPFYFGQVRGPTVARKRGSLVLTVSPMPEQDAIGRALAAALEQVPVVRQPLTAGDVLLVDNHRMLHGRTAFTDESREFLRLLAWLPTPFWSHPASFARAREVLDGPAPLSQRVRVVYELLSGVSPARLAAREQVSEAELYRWRNAFFAGGAAALEPREFKR